ncbi:MAG TPA: FtsX-like permease family protein [Oceanipulchritudo sp.]|nr:FtsX-like permease family protein [Oceanipulchritudo sp.]
MKWQLLIAWRNLWRNPRRTVIILVAVVVGIWMMLFMGSIMWGMVRGMLETSLANLTGHIEVHHPGYLDDPAIENRMENPGELRSLLADILPEGSHVAWRIRFDVVASNARHSSGLTLVGTDFDSAMKMTFLKEAAIQGNLPDKESANGILVGKELLADFETEIGNKLILMSRDTSGETVSMAFRISGSFDTFLESNEKGFAFVPIGIVDNFLGMQGAVSEVSIHLPDIEQTDAVAAALQARLNPGKYEVSTWPERIPMVTAYIKIWDYFAYIWGIVVFMAMGFGLVNTLLMAVYDRIREFGLVRALGTRPTRIMVGVVLEACLLLLVGLLIGTVLAMAFVSWLGVHGIDLTAFSATAEIFGTSRIIYPEVKPKDIVVFNGLVFGLGILVSLYPAIKAARFTPVEAMTHFK